MARSPLYDLYDPSGRLRAQAEAGGEDATLEDLMPEDEKSSLLRKLADVGSSGIAGLGWLLDTPGSIVRGGLHSGLGKAASALWDTTDDRVSGRELARSYGLAGDEDTWSNFGGGLAAEVLLDPTTYASLGLNVLLGRGAKTAAGLLAQKAGLLQGTDVAAHALNTGHRQFLRKSTTRSLLESMTDDVAREEAKKNFLFNADKVVKKTGRTVDQLMDDPITRTNQLGFMGYDVGATDFFGEKAGDWLAKFADDLGEGAKHAPLLGPAYLTSQRWFNPDVLKQTTVENQWRARQAENLRRQREVPFKREFAAREGDVIRHLQDNPIDVDGVAVQLTPNDPEYTAVMRNIMEGLGVLNKVPELPVAPILGSPDYAAAKRAYDRAVQSRLKMAAAMKVAQDETTPHGQLVKWFQGFREEAKANAEKMGLPLDSYWSKAGTEFFPRQQTRFDNEMVPGPNKEGRFGQARQWLNFRRGSQAAEVSDASSVGRKAELDVLGGTHVLNDMSVADELAELLRNTPNNQVRQVLDDYHRAKFPEIQRNGGGVYSHLDDEVNPDLQNWTTPADLPKGHPLNKQIAGIEQQLRGFAPRKQLQDKINMNTFLVGDPNGIPQPALQKELDDAIAQLAQRDKLSDELDTLRGQYTQAADQLRLDTFNEAVAKHEAAKEKNYIKLADFLRKMDPQHAQKGVPIFGQNIFNEIKRYGQSRARVESNAEFLMNMINPDKGGPMAAEFRAVDTVPGGVNYSAQEAGQKLGFDKDKFAAMWAAATGTHPDEMSIDKNFIDQWASRASPGKTTPGFEELLSSYDAYTKGFKTLALLWPARYTRDDYSGSFAAATKGLFNFKDRAIGARIGRGNYFDDGWFSPSLAKRLEDTFYGSIKDPRERVRKFLIDAGGEGLGSSTASDDLMRGASSTNMVEGFPGAAGKMRSSLSKMAYNPDRTWGGAVWDFLSTRGSSGNTNPILEAGDRLAEFTDARNRYGTYLTAIRKGNSPAEARRLADLTQVNYKPEAFTDVERDVLKRIFPFYSYTKGITPYIADQVVNHPSGGMGQAIRATNRGTEPKEDMFTPDYLRQSASIPLPGGFPLVGLSADSPLQRFITNLDAPYEGPVNLGTPGIGNTAYEKLVSGLQKTGLNVLGQMNPLLKGPLEGLTNRQFYSGRQLSDLYSMLEQTMGAPGRTAEQVLVNLPGGSRVLGTTRQLTDQRLSPQERAVKFLVNALTGVKFQDVDEERTKQLAARDALNVLLSSTPGVRTYENITVPKEDLPNLPEAQKKMYLLYKIIQTEAARKAREKKKAEMDPLQALGIG
jgi:hypothetical protein